MIRIAMKIFKSIFLYSFVGFILFCNTSILTQTFIEDDITISTTWTLANSPYEIASELYIRDGAILTIESGVVVDFKNRFLFVGKYQSAKLIADGVTFNNGTVTFLQQSEGKITNCHFALSQLNLEEYSKPIIENNTFTSGSHIILHSPDAIPNLLENKFHSSKIYISFELDFDRTLKYFKHCTYEMDDDIYVSNNSTLKLEKDIVLNGRNNTIYVGDYSDSKLQANQITLKNTNIEFSNNSVGEIINSNLNSIHFSLNQSSELTVFNSNFNTESSITNNSTSTVNAANNYWGSANGPVGVLTGDIIYEPFSSTHLAPITSTENLNIIPSELKLEMNYPNPFNPVTTINYSIPKSVTNTNSPVLLKVFNLIGQEVATLVEEVQSAGTYSVKFDATNLNSGAYIYHLKYNGTSLSNKMILLK